MKDERAERGAIFSPEGLHWLLSMRRFNSVFFFLSRNGSPQLGTAGSGPTQVLVLKRPSIFWDAACRGERLADRAELLAKKGEGHLGACSVRRNWFRNGPECGVKAPCVRTCIHVLTRFCSEAR